MTRPTFRDAKRRALVSVARPGQPPVTGRLVFLPGGETNRRKGRKARIALPSGSWLSIDPGQITVLEEPA